jgi:hypothetical protein
MLRSLVVAVAVVVIGLTMTAYVGRDCFSLPLRSPSCFQPTRLLPHHHRHQQTVPHILDILAQYRTEMETRTRHMETSSGSRLLYSMASGPERRPPCFHATMPTTAATMAFSTIEVLAGTFRTLKMLLTWWLTS